MQHWLAYRHTAILVDQQVVHAPGREHRSTLGASFLESIWRDTIPRRRACIYGPSFFHLAWNFLQIGEQLNIYGHMFTSVVDCSKIGRAKLRRWVNRTQLYKEYKKAKSEKLWYTHITRKHSHLCLQFPNSFFR